MTKVLEDLWCGAIRPCEREVRPNSEYARLQSAMEKEHDRFWSMLTPEAKEAYNEFCKTNIELMAISDADCFAKGFRLGIQFLLAAIIEDNSQLPALEAD